MPLRPGRTAPTTTRLVLVMDRDALTVRPLQPLPVGCLRGFELIDSLEEESVRIAQGEDGRIRCDCNRGPFCRHQVACEETGLL